MIEFQRQFRGYKPGDRVDPATTVGHGSVPDLVRRGIARQVQPEQKQKRRPGRDKMVKGASNK